MNDKQLHFIAGLPRSGSTLLAAILRQNPNFCAGMSSPLRAMFIALQHAMSASTDTAMFLSDDKRRAMLRSLVSSYVSDRHEGVIFDTNRGWCQSLPVTASLFPDSRIVCCVRNPASVIDSIEYHVQRNSLEPTRLFDYEAGYTVYSRVEILTKPDGMVGYALGAFRQAWFGDYADKLIVVPYESLVDRPEEVIARLYDSLGLPRFAHDFDSLAYDEPEFDRQMAMSGFHRVRTRVQSLNREPVLPPDLYQIYDNSFWDDPGQNPKGVTVL